MSAGGLDLVIVGAGPTGLSLALEAARHDLSVRRFAPTVALDLDVVSRRARRLVSQLGIAYSGSPIVGEAADAPFADGPEPGDRAPDASLLRPAWPEGARVFDLLREPLDPTSIERFLDCYR